MQESNVDLRLLRIFDAVLAERNVSRAAERLGVGQSTVSKGIAQLRELFGDPLFLRTASGVAPTHKALEIAADVAHALAALDRLTREDTAFDPASAEVEFSVGATDYVAFVLLPALLEKVAVDAPRVRIVVHDIDESSPEDLLLSGKVDLVLSSAIEMAFPIHTQALFSDEYVCAFRQSHPLADGPVTLEGFMSRRHVAMPRQHGGRERVLTRTLQQLGIEREIAVSLPHMLAAPQTLIMTDFVMTLASRVARAFRNVYPIATARHPLELGRFEIHQLWHDRTHRSPSHRWMRSLIHSVGREI